VKISLQFVYGHSVAQLTTAAGCSSSSTRGPVIIIIIITVVQYSDKYLYNIIRTDSSNLFLYKMGNANTIDNHHNNLSENDRKIGAALGTVISKSFGPAFEAVKVELESVKAENPSMSFGEQSRLAAQNLREKGDH
jgi:hypothetical protein